MAVVEQLIAWRYVVGSFIVRIPVTTGEKMRVPEELTLAIMKWRLAQLSPGNRWAPVLERYIKYSSARLDGIGGDASQVPPSLTWTPSLPGEGKGGRGGEGGHGDPPHGRERCGRIVEVKFDCHGDLDGFVIEECCERHVIASRERGLTELLLRASRDDLVVCVRFCGRTGRVEGLTIRA